MPTMNRASENRIGRPTYVVSTGSLTLARAAVVRSWMRTMASAVLAMVATVLASATASATSSTDAGIHSCQMTSHPVIRNAIQATHHAV